MKASFHDADLFAGRAEEDVSRAHPHSVGDFAGMDIGSPVVQESRKETLVLWGEVLKKDNRKAELPRQCADKAVEGVEATGRSADSYNRERSRAVKLRCQTVLLI